MISKHILIKFWLRDFFENFHFWGQFEHFWGHLGSLFGHFFHYFLIFIDFFRNFIFFHNLVFLLILNIFGVIWIIFFDNFWFFLTFSNILIFFTILHFSKIYVYCERSNELQGVNIFQGTPRNSLEFPWSSLVDTIIESKEYMKLSKETMTDFHRFPWNSVQNYWSYL